jgi:uncharacterized repeat protein (TIGR01451 family)
MSLLRRCFALLASLACLAGPVTDAGASHFRFANLAWKRAPGTNSLAVEITVTEAWRTGSGGIGEISYQLGDGGGFSTSAATRIATLTDIAGEAYEVWRYTTTHIYPSNGLFTVTGSSCCRISTLANAADDSEAFTMLVDLRTPANTGSPVTTAPVILQMQAGTNNSVALPIVDPDGDSFSVRLATVAEASGSEFGTYTTPTVGTNVLSVTAAGVLNWNTAGGASGQKFALQVIIEENRAGNTTGTNGRVPLDFIIELAGSLTNQPPAVTGTNGSIVIAPNRLFTATFTGTDPEGGPLRVNHQGLPPGATITPADGTTNASPASVTFSWTPAPADVGSSYAVLIFFTDQGGLQRAASFALTVSATAVARDFELLSINSAGTASGNGSSQNPVVSTNGQYVAFASEATNLVANDANGARDVFWRDRVAGVTRLVSRTPAGASGNGESDAPVISADGRYVAFHSRADNLVSGDTNGRYDVFVWDSQDNSVALVSRTVAGVSGAGHSFSPRMSASGRVIAFASDAPDLAGADANGTLDAFARDLDAGVTHLVSATPGGAAGNGSCGVPVISANGRFVAFVSLASDLAGNDTNGVDDVFVRDLQARTTVLASVNPAGTASGSRFSFEPNLSADGRYVAFASQATNLVATPDTNGAADVFVRDLQLGMTKLVSVNGSGTAAGGNAGVATLRAESVSPVLSADGTKVLFLSFAQDLVANDSNAKPDVFLRDHVNQTTLLISTNRFGTGTGNGSSGAGLHAMSADGRYVAFFSEAANLGAADTNNRTDIFLRDLTANSTKIISRVSDGGFAANGHSFQPVLSADGSTVLFASEAGNLDNRDANGTRDVFAASTSLGAPNFGVADVAVSLSSVAAQSVGATFSLTVTVTNRSATPVTGLVLANSGPVFLQFGSATASQGSISADTWILGDLEANGSATATVSLTATNLGQGNVVVSITRRDQPDSDLNNNAAFSTVTVNQTAAGALFYLPGDTAYVSRTNSPFFTGILAGTVTLEAFERGAFNIAGVTASAGVTRPAGANTDSVDADDGLVDGSGTGGQSYFVAATNEVTFTFDAAVLGRLPTKAGIVLTDGDHEGAGIEAFGTNGASLGVIGPFEIGDTLSTGETAEDRFLGVEFAGGISALRVFYPAAGFEVDHLQFDIPTTDLAMSGAGPTNTAFGSTFSLTLTVTNRGPVAATGIVVTNADPGDVAFLGATVSQGTVDTNGLWSVGTLAAGASASFTATLAPEGSGLFFFRAGVSSAVPDAHTGNDTVTVSVFVPNSAPNLRFASNTLVLPEDLPALSFPAFLQVHPQESNQLITNVSVSVDNPALFAVAPALGTNGLLTLTLAPNASGSALVTVLATDNGGTLGGGVATGSNAFTVVVTPVNDPPLFGFATNHVQTLEDAGAQTLPGFITSLTTGPGDESGQSVTNYLVTTSSNALFAVPPAVALNGTLTFTPAADASGSVTVTVVAQDNGGTAGGGVDKATNTFTLTVTAVNDAPSVTFATNNVVVPQDSGARLVAGFATPGFGPADEAGQAVLSYTVSPNSAALFQVAPAISFGGDLTFTPATGASGSTPVTVVVRDSGGTANGGVDLATNTFTITITAPVATNFTWLGGSGDWHDAAQWSPVGVPGALDSASLSGGAVQLTNSVTVAGLALSGGTLTGSGGLTIASNMSWTAGVISGSGGLMIATGATVAVSGGSTKTLARPVDNAGTWTWTGGTVVGNNNPTFNHQAGALFDIQVDGTFFTTSDSSVRTFNNAGTVRKSAGAGTTSWEGILNNGGTVEVAAGTVSFSGAGLSSGTFTNAAGALLAWTSGAFELTNGAAFTGLGTWRIAGGTLNVSGGTTVSHTGTFELTGGALGGAGNFTVPAGSQFNWTAGTMATGGVFTVAAGGSLTLSSGSTKTLRRQLDNAGTVTWSGGTVLGNDGPTFNNQAGALFNVQNDGAFFSTSDSSVRTFNNAGTVRKTAGTGTTSWDGVFNNDGTLSVRTGTLNLVGTGLSSGTFESTAGSQLTWTTTGTHELAGGATFTGAGTSRVASGTLAVGAGVTVSHEGTFELAGGTLGGAGNFTVPAGSQFNWTGGTLGTGGVFTVSSGGTVTISGAATKVLRRLFVNTGTVTWTGGAVQGNSNPTFDNQAGGVLDLQTDNTFFASSDSSTRTLLNAGTVRKSAGTGTTVWQDVFNNTGTVEVQAGTLQLTGSGLSSGAFTGAAGTVLEWSAGTHQLANGTTFGLTGTRRVSGGTVDVLAGASLSAAGVLEVTGGTLGGAGAITVPADGAFSWTAGTLGTGGVFTVSAGATATLSSGSTKTLRRQFDNQGTVTWTGGQVLGNNNPTFNNQAGAVFDVRADTTFFGSSDGSTPVFNNDGTVRKTAGTGSTVWQGTFNHNGLLELQQGLFSFGTTPNIGGASSLTVFLGGTTAGTQFGQVVVGNITFAGTLNVVLTNGFVPAVSNSFHIINGGTGSGVFTTTTGRVLGNGLVLETNYAGGDLTLTAAAVNTAPSFTFTNFPALEGTLEWTRDAGDASGALAGAGRRVLVDGAGNVIVAGDFDKNEGEGSYREVVLTKYQADGTPVWTNEFGSGSLVHDVLADARLNAAGEVFLLVAAAGSTTNFVTLKYLADGTPAWTNRFDSGGDDQPVALAVDGAGDVYASGAAPDLLQEVPRKDYLTIKYSGAGAPLWTNRTDRSGYDDVPAALVAAGGAVFLTGEGYDGDYHAAFTVKIDATAGTNVWTAEFGHDGQSLESAHGRGIGVDAGGNVLIAADQGFSGVVRLAVVKYDGSGAGVWTNAYLRTPGADSHVRGFALDSAGNALLTGDTYNGLDTDFSTLKIHGATGTNVWLNHLDRDGSGSGEEPAALIVTSADAVIVTGHTLDNSGKDHLTVKYASSGAPVWTNRYDSAGSMSPDDAAFALAADANGSVFVTGQSDTLVRTVKYATAPSPGANQVVASTAGAVSLPGFVTSISPGATTNEAGQTVTFSVANDNSALFTVPPAISAAGTLTYTVNATASGSATVTVTAQDNGGTDNGGVDTSVPQIFIVIVTNAPPLSTSYVWNGVTGDWHDAAKWTPRGVPGVYDTAAVSAGVATLTNSVAVRAFTLSGGELAGGGSLTVRSNMTWSAGTMSGAGAATIASNAVLTVNGGSDKDLRRRLDNYGTVAWTAGRILGHGTPTLNNYAGALFDLQADTTLFESGDSTTKTFNNTGTLRKSAGTGTTTIHGAFNQNGTANVQVGTVNPVGTVTLGTSSYGGAGRFLITGGSLAGTLTIAAGANVEFASGTMSGTGSIVGTLSWTGGTMGSGGTTTIATNGALVISGAADKDLRRTLDNFGTVTWTAGRILGHGTPTLINRSGAVFDAQVNTTLFESGDSTTKTFNNTGTVRRSAGTGTTTWNGLFKNDGVLRVETGTVSLNGGGTSAGTFTNLAGAVAQFTGGTHTLNNGAAFTGAGQSLVNGGTVNVAAGATATAAGTFGVASGTLGGTGTLLAAAGSQFLWTGGTMAGTTGRTVITNGATMTVSTGADKDLRRVLDNYGTVTWTAGRIVGHSTPTLNNYAGALLDVQVDTTLFDSADSTTKTFNNAGTLRKSAGTGTTTMHGTFNHTGAADIQAGTLNPDGAVTLGTSSYSGAGRFLITGGSLAGTLTIASGANVELAAGTLGGTGTIVGTLNWTSGTLGSGGTTIIATNGAVVAGSAADKDLRRTLDNYGTVTWTAGRILGHGTPTLHNRAGALFEARADTTLFESGDSTTKTFNNAGTVRRTAGTGTTTWNGLFNNSGTLAGESGTVALNGGGASAGVFTNLAGATIEFSGGTHTLNDGASFGGAGTNLVDGGTVNVAAGATATAAGTFGIASGTLGGTGTLLATAGSQFLWTGGTMAGTTGRTVITNGATMTVGTGADKDLRRILDNYGTVTWTAGRILGHGTPTLNNQAGALLDVQVDTTLFESGDSTTKTFNNAGTLRKSGGTGTATLHGTFNHTGTADIQTGTLNPDGVVTLGTSSYSGAGRFLITGGSLAGTLTIGGGANVELAAGTLGGTGVIVGTLNWTGGTLGAGGTTTISAGSLLLVSGAADKDLRRTLINSGTVLWTAGRILGHGTPVVSNLVGAVFETRVDATLFESGDSTTKTFHNLGTARKIASTGASVWHGAFNQSGALEIHTGILRLTGSYAPSAGSSLTSYLGGLTAGAQFGQLQVDGSSTLAGTLNVILTNGFTPAALDSFLVVGSGGGSGAFSSLVGGALGGGLTLSPTYLNGDATLTAVLSGGLPPLSPQATGTERLLRWPGGTDGFVLETAPAVTGPWTPVLAPVAQEHGASVVRLPAEGTRFYRLVPAGPPRPGNNPTQ